MKISSALHSYLNVADIRHIRINGLEKWSYFDKVTGQTAVQHDYLLVDREIDRIYRQVRYPLILHDRDRTIRIDAEGSCSAVVWNPWQKNCAAMADMENEGYRNMLCIETANVLEDARVILPEEEHTLTAVFRCGCNPADQEEKM